MSILNIKSIIQKNQQNCCNNFIYREFEKKNNQFIATNKFFISEEIDNKIEFTVINMINHNNHTNHTNHNNKNNQKIIPYENNDNIYILTNNYTNNKYFNKKYIDLILISNISFSLDELNIHKKEILRKYSENDIDIDEKFLEDLYYTKDFANKINIELPKKYGNKKFILEDIEINKKYLFKIKVNELPLNIYSENKELILL